MSSLRGKLVLWFALFSFVLAALIAFSMYVSIGHQLGEEDADLLAARVHGLRVFLNADSKDPDALGRELEWKSSSPSSVLSYARVEDLQDKVLAETRGMTSILPPEKFPELSGENQRVYFDLTSTSHEPYRAVAARIDGPAGKWIVQVAINRFEKDEFLRTYRRKAEAILIVGLLVSIAAGWILVHRGFRPIRNLVNASRRIRSSTLNERIDLEPLPDELKELGITLNGVLDRLEDSFSRLSRFSADLAHELRTPLNNLRGETEVALGKSRSPDEYRELLGSNLEEYDRIARMIDSLLFLARAEDPKFQVKREEFDVGRELEALFDFYEGLATDAGVALKFDVNPGTKGFLEKTLFLRAVGNLVLNAIRYTSQGGSVTARVRESSDTLRVEVQDTGCGIDRKHLPRLFERFYRADPSRASASGGVGLGLSIVRTIADAHHGKVEIESELGRGTIVRLSFHNRALAAPTL